MTPAALLAIGFSNAAVASLLALIACAAARLTRRAPLAHFLWALVILKLLTPPLFEVRLPIAAGWLGAPARESAERPAAASGRAPRGSPEASSLVASLPRPPASLPVVEEAPDPGPRRETARDLAAPAGVAAKHAVLSPAEPPLAEIEPAPRPLWLSQPVHPGRVLAVAWACGSLFWFALAASRLLRFRRLLRRAPPAPAALVAEVREVARRLGLKRPPEVIVPVARVSPLVWAFGRRARLVLPAELAGSLAGPERRTLIAHELAHLRRRDHWLRWLELAALGLYWWLPVAWWARRELRAAEEECCDAWVGWAFPEERRAYATTLFRTVDFLSQGPAALPEGASGMGQARLLERRFRMILHGRLTRRLPGPQRAALVSFAVLVLPWAAGLTAEDGARPETGDQAVAGDPDAAEPEGAPAPDEIRLQLEWDARSGTLSGRVGKQQSTSIADLVPAIRQSKEAHEKVLLSHPALKLGKKPFTVRIEAPADAPWRRVAEVVDLLKRQGFENIAFAEPGGNSRGQPWSRSFQRQGREYRVSLRNNEVTVSDSGDRVVWKTSLEVDTRNAQIDLVEQHGWLIVRSPDRQVFLDLATGKIVRQMGRGSPPGETPSPPAADRDSGLNPVAVDPQVEEMVTWQPPASRNALAASLHAPGALPGPPVDVVQLANSLIEARGAARLAKNKLETMADAAKAGVVSHGELAADKIRLETAEKKIDLLRRMATSTLKGIQVEMDGLREIEALAQRRYEAGQATEDAMLAVRMRRAHAETLVSLIEDILNE